MNPTLSACLRSWPYEPWLLASLATSAAIYLRGWLRLCRRESRPWIRGRGRGRGRRSRGQLAAFLGGLFAIFLALASPIEPFAALFLQIHMLQHVLLMMVAPPLIWLGEPFFPFLEGLPRPIRQVWVVPCLRSRFLHRFFVGLSHPKVALLLLVCASWGWHLPAAYELALRSSAWHYLQHACFLGTGLVFWYAVVRPYPSRPAWSPWLLLPYLILADLLNTVLSALLTFSDRLLYPYYGEVPRIGGLPALDDQSAAGLIMWIPGSLAYLVPLFAIGIRLLRGDNALRRQRNVASPLPTAGRVPQSRQLALPILGQPQHRKGRAGRAFDVLCVPLVGRFLRWRQARPVMQVPLLVLAGLVVADGFCGPPVGAMNLAGVLPWIHWRGLLILAMLAVGNVFCMACPFMLPRTLAKHVRQATRSWPGWLANKWLSVLLLVLFLWAYEALSLWNSPWWTAWIVLAYFLAAFAVDALFRGASFCKYVCPIGQFNFVQSLVSPFEVRVREPAVCSTCQTRDCIQGRGKIPGCELHLYQPRKSSNLDCTFCLDCIHACPHENVGILAVPPGRALWQDEARSGVGRFGRRLDLAALCLVLVFGAFANAAGMTGPVVNWQMRVSSAWGLHSSLVATTGFYLVALIGMPLLFVRIAAALSRRWGGGGLTENWAEIAARYAYALVPLGFSMWLAHYSFHFLTSYATVVPTFQRFVADSGWRLLGDPRWSCACCVPAAGWLIRAEIVVLDLGLLLSLYAGYRLSLSRTTSPVEAIRILAPWAGLMACLFAAGIWIVFQPMQMRGTMAMGG